MPHCLARQVLAWDLRATSFIDSAGVHLLVRHSARDDVRITVVDGPAAVRRIFDLVGVRTVLAFEAPARSSGHPTEPGS